jgi:hypothetical protein
MPEDLDCISREVIFFQNFIFVRIEIQKVISYQFDLFTIKIEKFIVGAPRHKSHGQNTLFS